MKRYLPLTVLLLGVLYVASTVSLPAPKAGSFDLTAFGRLPVLVNGRIKPFDTVARTSLLTLRTKQRVTTPAGETLTPIAWLADVLFVPQKADTYRHFRIDNLEVLDLVGLKPEDGDDKKYFSYVQLQPKLAEIERQAQLAEPVEAAVRTAFQKQIIRLREIVVLYQRLKHSLQLPDSPDFLTEITTFERALPAGVAAVRARQKGEAHDAAAFSAMIEMARRFEILDNFGYLLAIPPADSEANPNAWKKTGSALLETFGTGRMNPTVTAYAALGHAWREKQPAQFNEVEHLLRTQLAKRFDAPLHKSDIETRFNAAQPFYTSMVLYLGALLLAVISWLKWPEALGRSAFYLVLIAFGLTTAGIATRMWLEGRPPVTNLYSSALFVGWGSVGLCLILDQIYRNAIGSVAAGMIGFATLLIAHHVSLSGDFWLATHVVVVTIGYAATFLAGFLAIIYVIRGVFTKSLDKGTADALARMVYGIVCFATLFSLVGTVLGGIWADQSWGRFWGWDPKENGALIIVIWNAIILHCRWGGLVKQRGLIALALFGNVVTSWSWFGVNMLGVGLHSYGFMDSAFVWLVAFVSSQLALIALAALPLENWRSFRTTAS
jgi:ABC-type transport system involved in cytochrome c biogenesis permease subunit